MTTFTTEELENKTVAELRAIASGFGIVGMSKKRKDIIIDAIENYYDSMESDMDDDEYAGEDTERLPYINAGVHSILGRDNTYQTLISVSCGAASSNYPVVGRTVGFVKATYREILNIDTDSMAIVNGKEATDSYILGSSDVLEFVRKAGNKGC